MRTTRRILKPTECMHFHPDRCRSAVISHNKLPPNTPAPQSRPDKSMDHVLCLGHCLLGDLRCFQLTYQRQHVLAEVGHLFLKMQEAGKD